ncbi:PASTA domain-containing protein [Kribbella sp. NPDC000426]|uniref:PASTA domain-containing protein n=1 Tax=Kribbella sp. NPDC000426 TaxID=3154255 RepID=UPI003319C2EB
MNEILARIEILPDRVGVPSSRSLDDGRAGTAYAQRLRELGLRSEISTRTSTVYKPGRLVSIYPSPGTLLTPGETVTLTVIK